jgi:hypothetical protein
VGRGYDPLEIAWRPTAEREMGRASSFDVRGPTLEEGHRFGVRARDAQSTFSASSAN